jgi:hypothetical protein
VVAKRPIEIVSRAEAKARREHLELTYLMQIRQANLPTPERQVKLIPGRNWAWDAVYKAEMIAVEINGGTAKLGAHSSKAGLERDYEKANAANLAGYCVLAFSSDQVKNGVALAITKEALKRFFPF